MPKKCLKFENYGKFEREKIQNVKNYGSKNPECLNRQFYKNFNCHENWMQKIQCTAKKFKMFKKYLKILK